MNFFFIPDTCALAVHIALHEANIPFQPQELQQTPTGPEPKITSDPNLDYHSINPKGKVPAIELQESGILTETQAILQYLAWEIAPKNGVRGLIPQTGLERWRAVELLNFTTSELHLGFGPLFNPNISPKHREFAQGRLEKSLTVLQNILGNREFLLGDSFTVIDCYAWTTLTWTRLVTGVDLDKWPLLVDYRRRIFQRPNVQKALEEEHLNWNF